ncbi:pentapeptide repeat-containing protein [Paraburkholderia dinghuensis]|uniref:Pentapeptide repeat-containing protein n=1 Tax=Paraburkholderia dinghuensis TaxID=2305225 RepID=A0A3N6M6Q3_9BURK|nr:pentapeptide repeat-containing protein [Paraburkholderia dinghuensis]RQG99268.1 pentapeptide repeat-containing protein [Paraburkholderia dinghuensis]
MRKNSPSRLRLKKRFALPNTEVPKPSRWNQRWSYVNALLTLVILAASAAFAYLQNVRSEQQNRIAESTRRAGQLAEVVATFDAIQEEQRQYCHIYEDSRFCVETRSSLVEGRRAQHIADELPDQLFHVSTTLSARIVALSVALRPYQYLQFHELNPTIWESKELNCSSALVDQLNMKSARTAGLAIDRADAEILEKAPLADQLIDRAYSPERSQLLLFLAQAHVDLAPLISTGADFSRVLMDDAHLDRIVMSDASFSASRFIGASLMGASLTHTSFDETDLSCSSLMFANLNGTISRYASFAGADLARASLVHAVISNSDFRVKTLAGADLRGAILKESCLGNPESFYGATIDRMTLAGALVTSPAWLDIVARQPDSVHGFHRADWVIKAKSDTTCDGKPAYQITWPVGFDVVSYVRDHPIIPITTSSQTSQDR